MRSKPNLEVELSCLLSELKEKRYRRSTGTAGDSAVNPDGGERLLGHPTVRDACATSTCVTLLETDLRRDFHPSSYGLPPAPPAPIRRSAKRNCSFAA